MDPDHHSDAQGQDSSLDGSLVSDNLLAGPHAGEIDPGIAAGSDPYLQIVGQCQSDALQALVYKHALRNALLPVVTVAGIQLGHILAGAILVETVFSWPGMGRLMFEGILRRDYPLIMRILIFSSVMVIIANLLTDILYGFLDPRIRRR